MSINPEFWDFEKSKPKRNYPNRVQLEKLISDKLLTFTEQILEFGSMNREFTATALVEKVSKPIKLKTVNDVFLEYIQRLIVEPWQLLLFPKIQYCELRPKTM